MDLSREHHHTFATPTKTSTSSIKVHIMVRKRVRDAEAAPEVSMTGVDNGEDSGSEDVCPSPTPPLVRACVPFTDEFSGCGYD